MAEPRKKGKVFLVGVGPGDEQLVTLAAVERIRRADVIVYDHLMSPGLLNYAPPQAKLIYVGKNPGKHVVKQEKINRMLVVLAGKHDRVVRLKGGDPFLFGRGSEEALFLRKNRIDFEVVPGVSSGFAVAAYSGIPLTHRGIASHVTFVTGHEDPLKKESSVNWADLAKLGGTLVIFMGMARLDIIMQSLLRAGMPGSLPVCVTQWGTLPEQKAVTGTIADITARVKQKKITHPAIVIIGEAVSLRSRLNWFESKPLFGKKILITRPQGLCADFKAEIERLGGRALLYPLIEIVENPRINAAAVIGKIQASDWIIFTSRSAVKICFDILDKQNKDARIFSKTKIAVLGEETRGMLRQRGIIADILPKKFYMESLIREFKRVDLSGKKVFLPHSAQGRALLCQELKKQGAVIDEEFIYRVDKPLAAKSAELKRILEKESLDFITLTSSSCVHQFMRLLGKEKKLLKKQKFAVIGPITKQTLLSYGYKSAAEAKVFTAAGLVKAMIKNKGKT